MDHREQIYDQWLVTRCQDDDLSAFDELMARWQERLWRHAFRLTGDSEASWDILQETMLAISRRIGRLRDPAAFPAWTYTIATNRCRDFLRRKQRDRRVLEACFAREPMAAMVDWATVMDLQEAMRRLPGTQQTLLALRYEEGFSVAEIAKVLGVPSGTVKSRLHTARQQLRSLLEETDDEP
jgi:RNA polymerase sigma-70 factor (ECF subfamily)